VAFSLYCQIPFGKLHHRNPEIIKYAEFIERTPSALAMKLSNIASLDPVITSSGRRGLEGASLADKSMWKEMQDNWGDFIEESEKEMQRITESDKFLSSKIIPQEDEPETTDFRGTNKAVQTKVRVGQSFFRTAVLSAYNNKCCISGLTIPQLLVASHIIPWRVDESNRLNPKNGLLLSMLHDKAFDLGLITVNEDMTIRVSKKEPTSNDSFYETSIRAFEGKEITLPEKFLPHSEFLAYHREYIFDK
jgi:predicted restriction endonuclease